jgi:hypothetical protein
MRFRGEATGDASTIVQQPLRYKGSGEWKDGNRYSIGGLKHLERAAKEARERLEAWQKQNSREPKNAA